LVATRPNQHLFNAPESLVSSLPPIPTSSSPHFILTHFILTSSTMSGVAEEGKFYSFNENNQLLDKPIEEASASFKAALANTQAKHKAHRAAALITRAAWGKEQAEKTYPVPGQEFRTTPQYEAAIDETNLAMLTEHSLYMQCVAAEMQRNQARLVLNALKYRRAQYKMSGLVECWGWEGDDGLLRIEHPSLINNPEVQEGLAAYNDARVSVHRAMWLTQSAAYKTGASATPGAAKIPDAATTPSAATKPHAAAKPQEGSAPGCRHCS
jgi:hypothetical protein